MRERMSRGKRTDNDEGKFVYGIPVEGEPLLGMGKCTYIITKPGVQWVDGVYMTYDECIEVDPETVCQFTGLYDKNGRKIFEGDIVKYRNDIRVIIYDNITLCFEMCYAQYYSSNWNCNCGGLYGRITANKKVEVIGNVFDNPELLEVKQNG